MQIVMTIGDINCNAQVLLNELTCRIPKGLDIPRSGLPVRVRVNEKFQIQWGMEWGWGTLRSAARLRQSSPVKTVSPADCRCL